MSNFVQAQGRGKYSAVGCALRLEKMHFVQPQEYIEYFEDSAIGCALRLEKMHFVQNFESDAGTLV